LRRHYKVGGINTWCYFASVPGSTASYPIDGVPWFDEVKPILCPRDTRSTREEIPQVVVTAVTVDAGRAKRPRPAESSLVKVSRRILEETAWDSPEARLIFASKEDDASTDVLEVIVKRQTLLYAAHYNATGYKSIVEGHDPNNLLSTHHVFMIRLKAQYIHTALHFASKEWIPGSVTWENCCETLEVEEPLLEHGWVNKPKGLLQVLWERGFIDPVKAGLLDYVVHDKPGCKGLRTMVAELRDFENEETRLQYVGQKLGLMIDRSPKYHPECAGEGIEYSWGCGKGMYRYLPIASKKGKDNFLKQVRVCLSSKPDTGNLRVSRIRSFARRQRRYICAYDLLHRQETERRQHPATAENEELIVVPAIIERYVKHFKCHRCIYDSERGYLGTFLRENRNISS
jgi:hypothetical protein